MAKIVAVTDAIKSLAEAESRFNLSRCENEEFFTELQALAYMMANPVKDQPLFGMLTNGDDVLFVKLIAQPIPQYSLSRAFSIYTIASELRSAFQILKHLGQRITNS